jgi:hypothetical protein
MTSTTIVGVLVTADGMASQRYLHQPEPERVGFSLAYRLPPSVMRTRSFAVDALQVRTVQRSFVAVDIEHIPGSAVGQCEHLELRQDGSLWATLTVYGQLPESPLFLSPEIRTRSDGTDLRVERVALTGRPAQVCMQPVRVFPGLDRHRDWQAQVPPHLRDMVTRARDVARRRRSDEPLVVFDADVRRGDRREAAEVGLLERRAGGELWRSAPHAGVLRVS